MTRCLYQLYQEENSLQKHCVKSVQIRNYFWSVFSCIESKYRKMQTINNSVFGHFSRSDIINDSLKKMLENTENP